MQISVFYLWALYALLWLHYNFTMLNARSEKAENQASCLGPAVKLN